MEHLIYLCPNYAEKLWAEFGLALTQSIAQFTEEYTVRIELTPKEIIYNKPHPAILLRNTAFLLWYRRSSLILSFAGCNSLSR
jgi:hypothetical protein